MDTHFVFLARVPSCRDISRGQNHPAYKRFMKVEKAIKDDGIFFDIPSVKVWYIF